MRSIIGGIKANKKAIIVKTLIVGGVAAGLALGLKKTLSKDDEEGNGFEDEAVESEGNYAETDNQ